MARAHAHLLTSIWSDPDWLALSQSAQHTYLLLLSQPKLTMIGLLDVLPSRWARLATDSDLASVEAAIDELEASRFILVDRHTDELVIRTFVRHEASPSKVANPRWLAGVWGAWDRIESRQLRGEVLGEIPASVWGSEKVKPPPEAQNPTSAQKLLAETSDRTNGQNVPQLPVTSHQSPDAVADNKQPGNSRATDNPQAAVDKVFDEALELLTQREITRNPTRNGNVQRHAAAVHRAKRKDHQTAARQLITSTPAITANQLADLLEPAPALRPAAHHTAVSAYDNQQRAQMATAERHLRVIAGDACPICNDTGWTLDDTDNAIECKHQETP